MKAGKENGRREGKKINLRNNESTICLAILLVRPNLAGSAIIGILAGAVCAMLIVGAILIR